jgi:hypothetical protein
VPLRGACARTLSLRVLLRPRHLTAPKDDFVLGTLRPVLGRAMVMYVWAELALWTFERSAGHVGLTQLALCTLAFWMYLLGASWRGGVGEGVCAAVLVPDISRPACDDLALQS